MYKVSTLKRFVTHKGVKAATLLLAITLAACGGGSSGNPSSVTNSAATPSGASDASTPTPSANASFFDSIFLDGSGAGYYQFGANLRPGSSTPLATGRTRFFVTGESDLNFSRSIDIILGAYGSDLDYGYITAEGLFTSRNPNPSDIGTYSKIFQRLAQGYQLGMRGTSTALYEVTLTVQDVAGQPVSDVVRREEAVGNGLRSLLSSDGAIMPAGSQTYVQSGKVLVQHIIFDETNSVTGPSSGSLEQMQASVGGTIQTLGGYRYLIGNGSQSVYVEYNGTLHDGWLYNAGDVRDAMPSGYNKIAADFLAAEEKKVGL
ncbi:hypothetical protein [Paraburkholderia caribensis]|uniref:hypothetical protein n=1 Tax=Paraburkholderia caribensis TaxID=75105 RepID=UPI0034D1AD25